MCIHNSVAELHLAHLPCSSSFLYVDTFAWPNIVESFENLAWLTCGSRDTGEPGFMKPFADMPLAVSQRSYAWPFHEPCSMSHVCCFMVLFHVSVHFHPCFPSSFFPFPSIFVLQVESSSPPQHDSAAPLLRTSEVGSWRAAFLTNSPNGSDTNTAGNLCF